MNEQELRAQITDEILSGLTFEKFNGARLVTVICLNVIVDEGSDKTQAVCRFYLPNGLLIGEVPAKDIVATD